MATNNSDFKVKKGLIVTEDVTASSFVKSGGTSSQFLKADGSVDSSSYSTTTGISDVVDDTTPQLGGNLDVNGNDIVSTSNNPIDINPNGTGKVRINTTSTDGLKLDVRGNNNETVANFRVQTSSTNQTRTAIQLICGTTGTAATGLGARLQFRQGDDGFAGYAAGSIYSSRIDNSNHDLYIEPQGTGEVVLAGASKANKISVVAITGTTTLTDAQSGSYVYVTGSGAPTLPATAEVAQQYTIINNTGSDLTPGLGTSNISIPSSHTAISDDAARTYVAVAANTWFFVG